MLDIFAGSIDIDTSPGGAVDINCGPLTIGATGVIIDAPNSSRFKVTGNGSDLDLECQGTSSQVNIINSGGVTGTAIDIKATATGGGIRLQAATQDVQIDTGSSTGKTLVVTGNITATGSITSNQPSDIRFKTDLNKIENPLEKLSKINGYTFNWIESEAQNFFHGEDTGIVAQEVENLNLPGIVTTRDDGYKAVNYEKIVPLLIESIKSLQEQVSKLQEK